MPFLTPSTSERQIFLYFQGAQKWNIGLKWVNISILDILRFKVNFKLQLQEVKKLLGHKAKSCFFILNPLGLNIQSLFHTIFSISSFETLIFLEFEYRVFEYVKEFRFLSQKCDAFISLLQKIFWKLVQVKENVQLIKIFCRHLCR